MKYEKINQNRYCCVPTCLQMILKKNGYPYGNQEDIGYELGLIVPKKDKHLFKNVRVGEKPISGYGTQIQIETYSINNYFIRNNIPLEENYFYLDNINEIKQFLIENENNDIIVCFHCGTLYDNPSADWGHVSIIDHIQNNNVILVEPSQKRDYETIPIERLAKAIKKHGKEKRGGFWLIKKRSK